MDDKIDERMSDGRGGRPTAASGTPLWVISDPVTPSLNGSILLGWCVCVLASRFLPSLGAGLCVCIYKFGHFSGFSNKNMTKRQGECGICFVFSSSHPKRFYWDATGFYFLFDEHVGLSDHCWGISLGAGTWNLRVCVSLMVIVSNLYFMFKACLHGKSQTGRNGTG